MVKKQSVRSVIIVQRLMPHYRLPFFRLLMSRNADMDIRVFHGDMTWKNADSLGFTAQYFVNYPLRLFGFSFVFQPKLMLSVLRARPDILVIEGTFGVLTNFVLLLQRWMMQRPTLYWAAGWDNPEVTGYRRLIKSLFIRMSLFFSAGAIVYGSAGSKYLMAHGFPKEKIIVAQNTVDVESLIAQHDFWKEQGKLVRRKYGLEMPYVISYVGHLSPIKRVRVLLEAFLTMRTRRKDVGLLIIGGGQQESELKEFVKSENVPDVHFVGEVIDGVEAFFAASDLFVLPGTGGLALNQAMALGLPVISSVADGTEADLIVSGENGYIVPVDNVPALTAAIEKSLSSPQHLKELGESSLRIITAMATLENMVTSYSYAIRKALIRSQSA